MNSVHSDLPEQLRRLQAKTKRAAPACVSVFVLLTTFLTRLEAAPQLDQTVLRSFESLQTVIQDLETFVPDYMAKESVPGVAIALIRDGRIVWVKGFGSANRWTGRPVEANTVFEVASNSKVMTAFVALRLVDSGKLGLDVPLNKYLAEPWLPPSKYRDVVTLRHCLSHSSGLGHSTTSREILFPPGSRYSYSALGIEYVQEVVEKVGGRPLDRLGQDLLFGPLGMTSSSFIDPPLPAASRVANGHLWAVVPALFWSVSYLASLVLVGLIGWPIRGIVTHRWRPSKRAVTSVAKTALVPPLVGPFILLGRAGLTEFAWLIGFYGTASMAGLILAYLAGSWLIERVCSRRHGAALLARAAWVLLLIVGWGWLSLGLRNVPVPRWPVPRADGAGSARANAADLSRLLLELAKPTLLTAESAMELRTPQVRLNDDLSWGLGPGILHSGQGDALWQWGQHIDFQSFMIIYPEAGLGVVVLTNSDLLNPDVALIIAHRAVGGKIEPLLRAIHLQFNFQGEEKPDSSSSGRDVS